MPWKERTVFEQRRELVMLARQEDSNHSQLCERYGISRKTGYKWLYRTQKSGFDSLFALQTLDNILLASFTPQ